MKKLITLEEARNMSDTMIQIELGKICQYLQQLGLSKEEATDMVASSVSLGVAAHEKNLIEL